MSSTGFTELLHSIVIVFLWSAAVVVSINFGVESVFSYNLSERTLWHILLLVFALLASFFVQLPGTDLTHASTAGSVEAENVVKQPSVSSTPICNHHEDKELEILALKSANDKLDAAVARERKRTANAESKTKLAEKKRDDLSYELYISKERRHQDYLTHVDRLRELQVSNNELVDAEERIRTQVETVDRSEKLADDWRRKCWAHEENARKSRWEVNKCRAELLDTNKKMKKLLREANQKEAETARVCTHQRKELAHQRSELKRLTAKEKEPASEVLEMSPIKAVIDVAPTLPEAETLMDAVTFDFSPISAVATEPSEERTANEVIEVSPTVVDMAPARPGMKTLVAAVTTIDIFPISAVATEPSEGERTANEVYQFGSITAIMDAARTAPQTLTSTGATTTIDMPPTISEVMKSPKEDKAAEHASQMGPVTASIDTSPTPTLPVSENEALVGAVTTTSAFPPTSVATEPIEGSTGSAPSPPTTLNRKIKKPVSRLNRPGAAAVAATTPVLAPVSRTPHEEVDLLIQMVGMARAAQTKGQTKAALYDIIEQLSCLASICDRDEPDFIEYALGTLTSISSDEAPGNILPPFLREMAGSLCEQVRATLEQRVLQNLEADEEIDEGDVDMGDGAGHGEEDAGSDEEGEDDEVVMTWPDEIEGLSQLDLELLGEDL